MPAEIRYIGKDDENKLSKSKIQVQSKVRVPSKVQTATREITTDNEESKNKGSESGIAFFSGSVHFSELNTDT